MLSVLTEIGTQNHKRNAAKVVPFKRETQIPSLQSWAASGLDMLGTDHFASHPAHQPLEEDHEAFRLPGRNRPDLDVGKRHRSFGRQ